MTNKTHFYSRGLLGNEWSKKRPLVTLAPGGVSVRSCKGPQLYSRHTP